MRCRLPVLTLSLSLAAVGAGAAQPRQCAHSMVTAEAGDAVEVWVFDRAGRVQRFDEENYFYSRSERYRYDRRGRLTHTELLSYVGGGTDFEARGAVPVRTNVEAGRVTETREILDGTHRTRVSFDEVGRPARVERGRPEGSRSVTYECTYDLAGRPIHRRELHRYAGRLEHDLATHWLWRDGRLARVVRETFGDERVFEVHHRSAGVHLVSNDGTERETWAGACAPVFFGACSPALNPPPPDRRRARLPELRTREVRRRDATRQPPLVGRTLRRERLTLPRLRAAYPGYRVWTDVTFAEGSPGTAIPVVCVGVGDECTTRIHYDRQRRWTRATSRDPTFSLGGVRVGDRGRDLEGDFEGCRVRGDLGLVECRVRAVPGATALLAAPEGTTLRGDEEVNGDARDELTVVELEASAPE